MPWRLSMVSEKYKTRLIELISKHLPDAKIYLYGSRARGDHSPLSDIDVAVDMHGIPADKYKMAHISLSLEDLNIPLGIDVVDFNLVSESMRESIKKEGIVWKE